MRVIAKIPDVSLEPTADAVRAEPMAGRGRSALRRQADHDIPASTGDRPAAAACRRLLAAAVPTWPVAALAVIAALTWMIASRNEHDRLQRQRTELRMACDPVVAPAGSAAGMDGAGAVVR